MPFVLFSFIFNIESAVSEKDSESFWIGSVMDNPRLNTGHNGHSANTLLDISGFLKNFGQTEDAHNAYK